MVKANKADFTRVRDAYLEIIDHSPNLKQYARWEYGKHPTDEGLMKFIDDGNLFLLTDGASIAGVAAITPGQGEDYRQVQWRVDAKDHEVMTLHLWLEAALQFRHPSALSGRGGRQGHDA